MIYNHMEEDPSDPEQAFRKRLIIGLIIVLLIILSAYFI